jgi:hypothetical protein
MMVECSLSLQDARQQFWQHYSGNNRLHTTRKATDAFLQATRQQTRSHYLVLVNGTLTMNVVLCANTVHGPGLHGQQQTAHHMEGTQYLEACRSPTQGSKVRRIR